MENKVDEIVDEILSHEQTEKRVKSMRKKEDLTDIILEKEQSSISTAQKKKKNSVYSLFWNFVPENPKNSNVLKR